MNADQRILAEEQKKFVVAPDYATLRDQDFVTNAVFRTPETVAFAVITAAFAYRTRLFYHPAFPALEDGGSGDAGAWEDERERERTQSVSYLREALTSIAGEAARDAENLTDGARGLATVKKFLPVLVAFKTDGQLTTHHPLVHAFVCFTLNYNNLFLYPCRTCDGRSTMYRVKCIGTVRAEEQDQGAEGAGANAAVAVDVAAVFHGTTRDKLYSLIRNGPKTLQHTIQNGRVHGHGFYCSSNPATPASYSDALVCVYALREPHLYQKHGAGVYVVTRPEHLTLTYVIPRAADACTVQHVIRCTVGDVPRESAAAARMDAGRLAKEVTRVARDFSDAAEENAKPEEQHGIRVEIDERDMTRWIVRMRDFPPDTPLFADMKAADVREIVLKVELNDYPFSPPFVRVVRPRFRRHTGHVTYGGSLCAEFLTQSSTPYAWKPVFAMTAVLIMVKQLLAKDGRLDLSARADGGADGGGDAYTDGDARAAFHIASKTHGWQS